MNDLPSGRRLERLVALLERTLAQTGAKIEAPSRRLRDSDTGRVREHDVVITWDHGHHQIITAIECRDRSRPVGVPEVEAFADKCARTGVHNGVIVSSSGFTVSAREKAAARAITCMELSEVDEFDWLGMDAIVRYERQFGPIDARVTFVEDGPQEIAGIADGQGRALSHQDVMQTIINAVPKPENPDDEVGKVFPVRLHMKTPGWTATDDSGRSWPIDHILAETSFTMQRTASTVTRHRYVGGGKGYSIASAEAPLGHVQGRIMMVRHDDGSTSVYWTPDKEG